jgi:lysocardiolipin and lysophospholipid acyltransferase
LIFPEGTNLSNETKTRSNNYASKQTTYNRPYDYCLHPHITGFTYLLNTMRSGGMIPKLDLIDLFILILENIVDTVDDVTIGYEGEFPKTELDLLKGCFPKVVHFHVKRYKINELPTEDKQIGQWLEKLWDEKENRLKE